MPRHDDDSDDRPRRRPRDDDDRGPQRRRRPNDRAPRKKGNTGLLIGILVGIFVIIVCGGVSAAYFLSPFFKKAIDHAADELGPEAGAAAESEKNLQTIGSAVHATAANGVFPNNSYQVRPGQPPLPLLSWRVHLLPALGRNDLYQQFKLDEPWDGPNNIKLLDQMPDVYAGPAARTKAGPNKMFYRGFAGPGGLFEPGTAQNPNPQVLFPAGVTDGTSSTLFAVDAGEAVEWTRPDALDFSPGKPRPAFGGAYPGLPYAWVLMCDGSIHRMRKDVPDNTLRWLIGRRDGMVIPPGWDQ
jgi:hypothetical protein